MGLELVITWVNRILFSKLLEAQLVSYKGDEAYAFLYFRRIKNYDDLNSLYLSVLARRLDSQGEEARKQFEPFLLGGNIKPYTSNDRSFDLFNKNYPSIANSLNPFKVKLKNGAIRVIFDGKFVQLTIMKNLKSRKLCIKNFK